MKAISRIRNFFKRDVTGDAWSFLFRPNNSSTGQFLTEEDALKVSTVFRCVAILSQGVSTLPFYLYKNLKNGGKERAESNPLYKIFLYRPNHFQNSVEFFEQIMISLCLRGNAYIQKVMSVGGVVLELIPLMPDFVTIKGNSANLQYDYRGPGDFQTRTFYPDQIIHVRALPKNGIVGISPIDKAMEAVGLAIATERFGASFFANGVTPSGLLEHPSSMSDEAYDRLKKDFNEKQANAKDKHKTMILEEGTKWTPMGVTSEQAQFIKTRQFSVEDICRWFGVSPHMVGYISTTPGTSIEQLGLEFLIHTMRPWFVRIEAAFLTQLFDPSDYSKYTLEFLADAYLRGDNASRSAWYVAGLNNGYMNIDEVRSKENMNPLPDNLGQDHYRPLNMGVIGKPDPVPANGGGTPGAPTTTGATTGYSPGTAGAQGSDVNADNDGTARAKIGLLKPMIDNIMERIERRASKVRDNGKGDWSKFKSDSEKELTPLIDSIRAIVWGKTSEEDSLRVSGSILASFIENKAEKDANWAEIIEKELL